MKPSCEELYAFARTVAGLTKDGEDDGDGQPFEMGAEDAIESMHTLISKARSILGWPREG